MSGLEAVVALSVAGRALAYDLAPGRPMYADGLPWSAATFAAEPDHIPSVIAADRGRLQIFLPARDSGSSGRVFPLECVAEGSGFSVKCQWIESVAMSKVGSTSSEIVAAVGACHGNGRWGCFEQDLELWHVAPTGTDWPVATELATFQIDNGNTNAANFHVSQVVVGAVDKVARDDVVVTLLLDGERFESYLLLMEGLDEAMAEPVELDEPTEVANIRLADLDDDGDDDLLAGLPSLAAYENPRPTRLDLNQQAPVPVASGLDLAADALAVADLDGDGDLDIAASLCCDIPSSRPRNVVVLEGTGQVGGFQPPVVVFDKPAFELSAADIDDDGDHDLVLALGQDGIRVLTNQGELRFVHGPALTVTLDEHTVLGAFSVLVDHLDGDTDLDILQLSPGTVDTRTGEGGEPGVLVPLLNTDVNTLTVLPARKPLWFCATLAPNARAAAAPVAMVLALVGLSRRRR